MVETIRRHSVQDTLTNLNEEAEEREEEALVGNLRTATSQMTLEGTDLQRGRRRQRSHSNASSLDIEMRVDSTPTTPVSNSIQQLYVY